MTIWNDSFLRTIVDSPNTETEGKLARYLLEQRAISRDLGSGDLSAAKAIKSERYLAVLVDAKGVRHYWLPNGQYDGYDRDSQGKA